MSEKRSGNSGFHYVQPRRKIPKLDVSIVASSSFSSGPSRHQQVAAPMSKPVSKTKEPAYTNAAKSNYPPTTARAAIVAESMSEDMWGDDDDDLMIMMASQVAENVENANENILVMSMDTSFGAFLRDGQPISCSTQRPVEVATPTLDPLVKGPLFTSPDEEKFTEFLNPNQIDDISKHIDQYMANSQNSLATTTKPDKSQPANNRASTSSPSAKVELQQPNDLYNRNVQNAREVQTKFLAAQVAKLQEEKLHLQNEVSLLNDRCQTKGGEVAMLRYDLGQNKKIQNELSAEKMQECERIKSEYLGKLNEMDRQNEAQLTTIRFMQGEIASLKSRRANEQSFSSQSLAESKRTIPAGICQNMFQLHLNGTSATPVLPSDQLFTHLPPSDQKQRHTSGHINSLRSNIIHLQLIAAQHALTAQRAQRRKTSSVITEPPALPLSDQLRAIAFNSLSIIRDVCKAALHIRTTSNARPSSYSTMFYYYDAPDLNAVRKQLLAAEGRLNDDRELFVDEMQSSGRRVLFCLADICRRSSEFAKQLLLTTRSSSSSSSRGGSPTTVDLLIDTLAVIGLSVGIASVEMDSWLHYFGLIEAASMLLHSLACHYHQSNESSVHRLLHSLLFCRPNTRSLIHLSAALRELSSTGSAAAGNRSFLHTVCRHSAASVLINESKRRVQFHYTSCPLQMFAGLVQTEFDPYGSLMAGQLDIVLVVTRNTLVLLQNCVALPAAWMFGQSSSLAAKPAAHKDPCLCYAQLVCACIVLLYLCQRQWNEDGHAIDLQVMSTIARLGIIMIYDHFVIHCESIVLRAGGPFVKQRLHVIFAWMVKNAELFGFEHAHMQAIQAISHLRRIPHMVELLNAVQSTTSPDHTVQMGRKNESVRSSWGAMLAEVGRERDDGWEVDETQFFDDRVRQN